MGPYLRKYLRPPRFDRRPKYISFLFGEMTSEGAQAPQGCYFRDGKRRADFVLVIHPDDFEKLDKYIKNLTTFGLEFEGAKGKSVPMIFLLIHICQRAIEHFSKVFDIGNEEKKVYEINKKYVLGGTFETPLSNLPDKQKGEISSADRIMIINKLLTTTNFGDGPEEIGLQKMIKMGLIETAYPLHDGPLDINYSTSSQTHDRQMLYQHWANLSVWYKEVPLNVIKRYFGCEAAFYFSWLEFFNKMLIIPAIFGFLIIVINLIIVYVKTIPQVSEVCDEENMFICPTCLSNQACYYKPISENCIVARWNYVVDNYLTVIFAILMSFWATVFVNLWRRKSNLLNLKWDVKNVYSETNARLNHLERVKRRKFSNITGNLEPYQPLYSIFFRLAITTSICFFMIILDLVAVFCLTALKVVMKFVFKSMRIVKHHTFFWVMIIGCIIQVIIIKRFSKMYGKLSIKLTEYENPRTQKEFDNSVLYKKYVLSFANNYVSLFYMAFFKGLFYPLPHSKTLIPIIAKDICSPPSPCVVGLCIQMFFLMIFKRFAGNVLTLFYPPIKKCMKRKFKIKEKGRQQLAQYEAEYKLQPVDQYFLNSEFSEMVLQFGFVTFFVAAFPLAPLCCLLNNILEMRLDAYKMIAMYRRPIPKMVSGIGAWDGILSGLTYISSATNGLVIAFTSDFVSREVYRSQNSHLRGFINYTISAYATKDNPLYDDIKPQKEICYYRGMRNAPSDPNKYALTSDYWVDFTWRLVFVLIFEHIILLMNTVLSFIIPDIPRVVKDQLNMDRKLAREAKSELHGDKRTKPMPATTSQRKKNVTQVGPIGGYSF